MPDGHVQALPHERNDEQIGIMIAKARTQAVMLQAEQLARFWLLVENHAVMKRQGYGCARPSKKWQSPPMALR
jgi:hypothetical protein